jgi:hypothetical protein
MLQGGFSIQLDAAVFPSSAHELKVLALAGGYSFDIEPIGSRL